MTRRLLQLPATGLALALVAAAVAGARAQATQITLSATLDATQEIPAPTGDVSAARGTFTATLTRTPEGATINWTLVFTGLTGPAAAAHIHPGARGDTGGVALPLCGPCTSGASGTANITDVSLQTLLKTGGTYVNVHTGTNRAGEIRGQVTVASGVRSVLTAAREVPKPKGTRRGVRGTFTGNIAKEGPTAVLSWRLTFRRLTGRAVAAHIHLGRAGRAGPVAVPLCGPCRSGANGRATLRPNVVAALENARVRERAYGAQPCRRDPRPAAAHPAHADLGDTTP